jgi:hypothetical protein
VPTANKTGKNTKFVSVSHAQYAHPFPPSGLMSVSFFGVSSQTLTRRDFLTNCQKNYEKLKKKIVITKSNVIIKLSVVVTFLGFLTHLRSKKLLTLGLKGSSELRWQLHIQN